MVKSKSKSNLVKTVGIPVDAKRIPWRPLALGEVTGHHHSLTAGGVALETLPAEEAAPLGEMYEKNGEIYVRITSETGLAIQHQEHTGHVAAPGDYKIVIQQEETDWGAAPVVD